MPTHLEIEFRVYRTPEAGGKRECVVTRSVPHALETWEESIDAYDRSLELVLSGDWLMQVLAQNGGLVKPCDDVEMAQVDRARLIALCVEALTTDDAVLKQHCLEEMLVLLEGDLAVEQESP